MMKRFIDSSLDPSNKNKLKYLVIVPLVFIGWVLLVLDGLVVVAHSYGDPEDDV